MNDELTIDYVVSGENNTPHPVLAKLYDQIATLEKKVETLSSERENFRTRANELSNNFANYKYKLENVLTTLAEDNGNLTAALTIADEFDIALKNTKDFEVTATFRISVTVPWGEEIELSEYDFSASLESWEHNFEIEDSNIDKIEEM